MEEIDVSDMEDQEHNKDIIKRLVQKKKEREMMQQPAKQKKNPIMRIKMPKIMKPKLENKPKLNAKQEGEVFDSMKNSIFHILSLPMKEKEKRPILKNKLMGSEFMNAYIKNNLYMNYLSGLSDHYKAGLIYSYHYANALMENIPANNINNV